MSAWLDEITALLKDSLGDRDRRAEALRAAREVDKLPGDFGGLRAAVHAWVRECGYLRDAPAPTDGLPWTVLLAEDEVAARVHERNKYMRADALRDAIEAEKRAQAAAWEARINRCKVALINGWPQDEAIAFVCALDEWQLALKRAERAP